MTEQKHYITVAEIMEDINESYGFSTYQEVIDSVSTAGEKPFGLIPLRDFFDEAYNSGDFLSLVELNKYFNELFKIWGEVTFWESSYDNTYNYGGYMEKEITWKAFENSCTDEVIVFFAINKGTDPRYNYTPYFAMKFDNIYDFWTALGNRFEVVFMEYVNADGRECDISIDSSPLSEYLSIYFHEFGSDYEESLDIYDEETAIQSIKDYMKDDLIDFEENSVKVVSF